MILNDFWKISETRIFTGKFIFINAEVLPKREFATAQSNVKIRADKKKRL